jgi:hypothetical protein
MLFSHFLHRPASEDINPTKRGTHQPRTHPGGRNNGAEVTGYGTLESVSGLDSPHAACGEHESVGTGLGRTFFLIFDFLYKQLYVAKANV